MKNNMKTTTTTTTPQATTASLNRSKILRGLNTGICEIKYINTTNGKSDTVSVTMRGFNIKDECLDDWVDVSDDATTNQSVTVWNMVTERWMSIPLNDILFFEQLTGAMIQ